MKKLVPALCVACLAAAGIFAYRALYVVPVIMYHSIAAAQNDQEYANSVSPEAFARQMAFLKRHGYRVLSVDEYAEAVGNKRDLCCNSVLITFDDGLENNYTRALEVLRKNNFPAVFFVVAGTVGNPGLMTWDQLREASAGNITVGSHTLSHAYLPDAPREKQVFEITQSKMVMEAALGKPVDYLAYPVGGFSEEIKQIVREAGYKAAFTTNRGYNHFNRDLFDLKRIRPKESDTDLVFWAKLSGVYNLTRKSKSPY